jgi:hypothetical protein
MSREGGKLGSARKNKRRKLTGSATAKNVDAEGGDFSLSEVIRMGGDEGDYNSLKVLHRFSFRWPHSKNMCSSDYVHPNPS